MYIHTFILLNFNKKFNQGKPATYYTIVSPTDDYRFCLSFSVVKGKNSGEPPAVLFKEHIQL